MADSTGFKKGIDLFSVVQVSCFCCGSSHARCIRAMKPYRMVQCDVCGFVYLNPRPAEESLRSYYESHYLPHDPETIDLWNRMMKNVFSDAADRLTRVCGSGSVLDIGCGYGLFLKEMRNRGWEVTGLEISRSGADYARKALSLPVYESTLEDCAFPREQFDAISAFYVVEHAFNPLRFIQKIHTLLKPGGIVLLRYPHSTPLNRLLGILKISNNVYDIPFHLSDFSPRTIELFLLKAGFSGCRHFIGGYTIPYTFVNKISSIVSGGLAEYLYAATFGQFLLPGVSKTVTAVSSAP